MEVRQLSLLGNGEMQKFILGNKLCSVACLPGKVYLPGMGLMSPGDQLVVLNSAVCLQLSGDSGVGLLQRERTQIY